MEWSSVSWELEQPEKSQDTEDHSIDGSTTEKPEKETAPSTDLVTPTTGAQRPDRQGSKGAAQNNEKERKKEAAQRVTDDEEPRLVVVVPGDVGKLQECHCPAKANCQEYTRQPASLPRAVHSEGVVQDASRWRTMQPTLKEKMTEHNHPSGHPKDPADLRNERCDSRESGDPD